MQKMDIFVSVVLSAEGIADSDSFEGYVAGVERMLNSHYHHYEIVVIDDGTNPALTKSGKNLLREVVSIRWLNTMSPSNRDVLPGVGIENAIGDYVVFLRASRDPIGIVPPLVDRCTCGKGMVVGVSDTPATWGYRLAKKALGLSGESSHVRCLDRKSINAVLRTEGGIKLLCSRLPFETFAYSPTDSAAVKKKTPADGFREFWKSFFSLSRPNFKWIVRGGALGSLCGVLLSAYSILVHFFVEDVVEGWTTTIFFVSVLFTILFVTIIFMGEYMEILLDEIRRKNRSYVLDEERSRVAVEGDRLNVAEP